MLGPFGEDTTPAYAARDVQFNPKRTQSQDEEQNSRTGGWCNDGSMAG